jgi:hypothetical protein
VSIPPVSLYNTLVQASPEQSPELINACLASGDILVTGRPTTAHAPVFRVGAQENHE